jgi:transglutaminase-like putative cysteine protease
MALTADLDSVSEKARALYDEAVAAPPKVSADALFIGMARAVGIPAKFSLGFELPAARGEGRIEGYRAWGEFYVPGYGWVPVDPTSARRRPDRADYFFGAYDENRVVFTVGRDIELNPRQKGRPLTFFIYPYAEADGARVEGIESQISYRDLGEAP